MDPYMKVGFCRNCGRAVKLLPAEGKLQKDWDRQATDRCTCMKIKSHGHTVIVRDFEQLSFLDK